MIEDKVLIFYSFVPNINSGGPDGFVAHNLCGSVGANYILLSELEQVYNNLFDRIVNKVKLQFTKVRNGTFKELFNYCAFLFLYKKCFNYKFVYFHSCIELFACKEFLSEEQVVILQSHSPQLPSEELKDGGFSIEDVLLMEKIEKFAFNRANYVIFPNEFCIPLYEKIINRNNHIKYLLSGSKKITNVVQLPLDNSKTNLLYIGRRNCIKGFDIVLEQFKRAYEINKNIRLILIGKGDTISHEGIIDMGFSKNPYLWYKSVDYVINANRKSYFDLSILEVLSIGTPIIMSSNYGHIFFNNSSKGILTFDSEHNLGELLLKLDMKKSDKEVMISDNLKFYNSFLTDSKYRERLGNCLNEIINKEKSK